MKKVIYLVLLSSLLYQGKVTAQSWRQGGVLEDRLAIGLAANYNTGEARFGISGHAKWLFPPRYRTSGRFLITGKITHTPDSTGGFFTVFDQGKYANITVAHLMGGYRYYFYDTYQYIGPVTGGDQFFVEGNAGVSYIGYDMSVGPAINPVVGFSAEFGLEFTLGYQGVLALQRDNKSLHLVEVGFTYRF
ncbi:hypothetical protein [Parapedobacter koreensis]|uniref:Outer membrane protein beta-barrel domain-containing protein n=1 Tax=Parapedobacter koreensis TaxID=332977 RepID=A0A1H7NQ38_9SPHI|nr:hypothetical protein [Parapedobacter koreensis]SEL25566.1 hypothetical protein SAMN05421740_10464 [Parapedobacter koreensis]